MIYIFTYFPLYCKGEVSEVSMKYNTCENNEIAFWKVFDAVNLVETYEKGQLKGNLKEISATLEEEDNPVIMLVKYKK
jgi:hypothetical protein